MITKYPIDAAKSKFSWQSYLPTDWPHVKSTDQDDIVFPWKEKDCLDNLTNRLVDHKSAPIDFRSDQSPRRSHEETHLLQLEEDLNAVRAMQHHLQFVKCGIFYIIAIQNIQLVAEPWSPPANKKELFHHSQYHCGYSDPFCSTPWGRLDVWSGWC